MHQMKWNEMINRWLTQTALTNWKIGKVRQLTRNRSSELIRICSFKKKEKCEKQWAKNTHEQSPIYNVFMKRTKAKRFQSGPQQLVPPTRNFRFEVWSDPDVVIPARWPLSTLFA